MSKVFDCIYSAPAAGKSESIARLIEHVYRTTGKTARVCVGDGSTLTYEHLVQAGVAEVYEYGATPWPQDTLLSLCRGWWPNDEGRLAPSSTQNIGVWVMEGLTVAGEYIMGHVQGGLAQRAGTGEKIGQESPIRIIEGIIDSKTGKVTSGPGTAIGGNPPSHFGVAQKTLLECLQQSKLLPVDYVLWTAHEGGNDPEKDLNKESIIGPALPGRALTATIQKAFNNTLHMVSVPKRTKGTDTHTGKMVDELDLEYRVYTRDHFSASGSVQTRFKACTRGGDNSMPQFVIASEPGTGLLQFYQQLAALRQTRTEALRTFVLAGVPQLV